MFDVIPTNAKAFTVEGARAALVGVWIDDELMTPSLPAISAGLPYKWRKAFNNAQMWRRNDSAGRFECFVCHVMGSRGKCLTSLYIRPSAGVTLSELV